MTRYAIVYDGMPRKMVSCFELKGSPATYGSVEEAQADIDDHKMIFGDQGFGLRVEECDEVQYPAKGE